MPQINYLPDKQQVEVDEGVTILEASWEGDIPHTHACGGSGRCSTCRVLVLSGLENCSDRTRAEKEVSDRLRFPPAIRLACQTQVFGDIQLRRLAIDSDDLELINDELAGKVMPESIGEEKYIAILFADIRGFTPFSEKLLPYDVIYVLNRYFRRMGEIVNRYNGTINNYMGDGLMALFGIDNSSQAAENAVRAAVDMVAAMENFNPHLEALYQQNLRIGIGINYGWVVIGEVGAFNNKRLTAIGDAVNLASRIESANKQVGSTLLISETTYEQVEKQVTIGRRVEVELPGKSGKYPLYEVLGISALPFSPKTIPQRRNNWFGKLLGGLIKKLLAIYFRVMRRNPKKK